MSLISSASRSTSPVTQALEASSQCPIHELVGANVIKELHDAVEIVAYRSLAQVVKDLRITGDRITEEQSGKILAYVKKQAHVELYREGGYWKERLNKLHPSQVQGVIRAVGNVIHDRDTKLTDARYTSLSELLMAFDDHNSEVKNILLQSWYKSPDFSDNDQGHLNYVKQQAGFYQAMDAQLNFDLEMALEDRQDFYDTHFPGLRAGVTDKSRSAEFVNVLEVRNYFDSNQIAFGVGGPDNYEYFDYGLSKPESFLYFFSTSPIVTVEGYNLSSKKLVDILDSRSHSDLFEPRSVRNLVRGKQVDLPPLLDKNMTLGEFVTKYFPEKLSPKQD